MNENMPLIKENQYLVNTNVWLRWPSKVVPAPINPHSVPAPPPAPPPAPLAPVNDLEDDDKDKLKYSATIWREAHDFRCKQIEKLKQHITHLTQENHRLTQENHRLTQEEITNLTQEIHRITQDIQRKDETRAKVIKDRLGTFKP